MSNLPELKDLKSLLEEHYKKNINIVKCEKKLLTAPGENYGSVMLAIDATIQTENSPPESKQFVAKMCPANQMLCDMFNIQETFKKELGMYVDVIPILAKLEEEYDVQEDKIEDMFAECLGGRINLAPGSDVVTNDAVLLLENLKSIGYDVGDRLTGFDLEHAELIIKNLAIFHAVPIAMKLLKPKIFEEIVMPVAKGALMGHGIDENTLEFMISEVTDIIKTKNECVLYVETIGEAMKYCLIGPYRTKVRESPFATIAHSDYWVNNTMILNNSNGKPIRDKIVDLQLPMYNSGVHDLIFFLYTSISQTVLDQNVDKLIKLYYDNFISRLKQFKIDISIFSWEAFQKEIKEVAPIEIGHILMMFKPILTLRGKIDDMATLDTNLFLNKDHVSKDYEQRILNTTLSFIKRELLTTTMKFE